MFRCGARSTSAIGLIDSGADGTLLPLSMAADLGLDETRDLTETPGGSSGAGGTTFPTWTTKHGITGKIVALGRDGAKFWGPEMRLKPVFAHGEQVLLGRSDFFAHFSITFVNHSRQHSRFHLDY